ncbi:hypothetical protein [Maridesulfovibrio sp.]|uniref:hypothetical protein n=1 Tax=Maridesulfovibrio sp. TaxID=2795000 RepID=UPI0029C9E294|nr:hypothetical protein [Maridesulfovibrio sp.]
METKEYTVLVRFRVPGEGWKEVGTTVEMTEVEARYLILESKVEVKKETSTKISKKVQTEAEG